MQGRSPTDPAITPTLHLAVQYASDHAAPTRGRVRRCVEAALAAASAAAGADAGASSLQPLVDATLTLRFVDVDEGRALNRAYRGKDYATNVLTFTLDEHPGHVAADIVVCLPVVEREAREQGKRFDDHCAHLLVHGTLHACGHDHEATQDAATMEELERRVLRRFRIVDPYA